MNPRAARRPRGDFDPLPQRAKLPKSGYVIPRQTEGPDYLRVGQVVRFELAGGEVTPGLSRIMLDSAGQAAAGDKAHSLFEFAGSHYTSPEDASMSLRVVHNPIPLLWVIGSVIGTLGAGWSIKKIFVDEKPVTPSPTPPSSAFSGVSFGIGGVPLLVGLAIAYFVVRR